MGRKKAEKKVELKSDEQNRQRLIELLVNHRKELKQFWSSTSIEEKWYLTEMNMLELADILVESVHWETLRVSLESYSRYAWEEDLLEITEDCVTMADDMCEENGMHDMFDAMLDAVELAGLEQPPSPSVAERGRVGPPRATDAREYRAGRICAQDRHVIRAQEAGAHGDAAGFGA